MATALIGYTGFIGGNLSGQYSGFTHFYNRANIANITTIEFDTIVCAGVRASKWWANQNPEADRQSIKALQEHLRHTRAKDFILISTIDVYEPANSKATEIIIPSPGQSAYGRHRLEFENWVTQNFANVLIVRLPGLFGPGLKKNIIFDLLTHNQTHIINPATVFQWYDVRRLWNDLVIAGQAKLNLVHLMPEPLPTQQILTACFPDSIVGPVNPNAANYDIRTVYGVTFGGGTRYIASAEQVLAALKNFVESVRTGRLSICKAA